MTLDREQSLKLYENMVRARKLDELVVRAFHEAKLIMFHSGQGEEAVAAGACSFLRSDDYIYITHRGHGLAYVVAKGGSMKGFLAEHYGKATGSCGGTSAVHYAEPEVGILGYSMILGSGFAVSVGWGLAAKKNDRQQVVVCFFGDGTSNRGTLHEAMNLVSLWKLPVVWVCSNNGYGQFTPIADAYPRKDIADLAASYDMPGVVVDGQDVLAVHEVVQSAVARARSGDGPSLIECKTYRYRSHGEGLNDLVHHWPRPTQEIEAWMRRDPIRLFREKLISGNMYTESDIDRVDREIDAEIAAVERFANESPLPEVDHVEDLLYAGPVEEENR